LASFPQMSSKLGRERHGFIAGPCVVHRGPRRSSVPPHPSPSFGHLGASSLRPLHCPHHQRRPHHRRGRRRRRHRLPLLQASAWQPAPSSTHRHYVCRCSNTIFRGVALSGRAANRIPEGCKLPSTELQMHIIDAREAS
jgi:hypothetical protein